MGHGFCFEARQKRLTFDNSHYRIDLVFYYRILKCHVLLDLKLGEFSHANAGQKNVCLNYYKEHEMQQNDKPPIGIIIYAGKNETLGEICHHGPAAESICHKIPYQLTQQKPAIIDH